VSTQTADGRRPLGRRLAMPIARVLIIVAVGVVAVWKLDLGEVHDAFRISSWGYLAVAVVANFASVGFKGLAWKGVVDALPGLHARTRYRDLLSPLFVGFLFNTVPPRASARSQGAVAAPAPDTARRAAADHHPARHRRGREPHLHGHWVVLVVAIGLFCRRRTPGSPRSRSARVPGHHGGRAAVEPGQLPG
jgi:hypothetical protein